MSWKEAVLVLCVVNTAAAAAPAADTTFRYAPPAADTTFRYAQPYTQVSTNEVEETIAAKYSFEWSVDHDPSSNEFGHQETRDGADTKGRYFVVLPDGRLQQVVFTVSEGSGYRPRVTYEGDSLESVESTESDETEEHDTSAFQEFDSGSEED